MRKNTLSLLILFAVITVAILVYKNDILLALPDIAHKDLTPISTKIKRGLEDSKTNGLKDALGGGSEGEIKKFDDKVSASNASEDYPPNSGWGAEHYFDPTTGMGMWGIFPNAKTRASDLYNSAMKVQCFSVPLGIVNATRPWEIFAQAMHLMQDMTTPAHTIIQDHADGDSFEKYVKKNWEMWDEGTPEEGRISGYTGLKDYVEKYAQNHPYKEQNEPSPYQLNNISEYMDNLAKDSHNLPKDGIKINTDPRTGMAYPERVPITWEQKREIAKIQLPKALMYGAGLINTFWNDLKNTDSRTVCIKYYLGGAGGDHSDDSFDVSNDFYLETEFKLSEADLTDLYLKTGMKKGKIGVWYKKQFIETYESLVTIYKDSPEEIRVPVLAKLYNISKKLEERINQLESDWEGAPDVALLTNGFFDSFIPLIRRIGDPVAQHGPAHPDQRQQTLDRAREHTRHFRHHGGELRL